MRPSDLIAVSGLGCVSSLGLGVAALAEGLRSSRSGIGSIRCFDPTSYDARVAAEVLTDVALRGAASRCEALGLVAAHEAWTSAGFDSCPRRTAVLFGTSAGGVRAVERFRRTQLTRPGNEDPAHLRSCAVASLGDAIAASLRLSGPRFGISTACSSSAVSVALAADLLRRGQADVALAGGAEAFSEFLHAGFSALMACDPETCRPFDLRRRGLVLGEGAAAVVLETVEHALSRGREPLALLRGHGFTCDSSHLTAPEPSGREVARTMEQALRAADVAPDQIDHVDAHGTATPRGDVAEVRGIARLLGDRAPNVTIGAMKSMLGHTLGAAGALGLVASVLQIRDGLRFATAHLEQIDPECAANHVIGETLQDAPRLIVSNSFAFGGNNVSLVIERYDP